MEPVYWKVQLPVVSFGRENGHVTFGFGYDVVNDDYKVVRILQFACTERKGWFCSDVKVYSLKSKSWKGVEEFPYLVKLRLCTYLNGALHWVVSTEIKIPLERLIVAFDLETEKCRIVPHPPYTNETFSVKLDVLGGCLCTSHSYWFDCFLDDWQYLDSFVDHMDIWVMKEYGVKESWTKIMSIEQPDTPIGRLVVPLAYSKSGEEILVEQDNIRFLWTNIGKGYTKIVDTQVGKLRGFLHFNSYIYFGSLVQLDSSDDASYLKKLFSQDKGGQRKTLKRRSIIWLICGYIVAQLHLV
ncbi:F-box protein CPR1-like [Lycium barbarum]|uniref:F-box protein CPR1-like n=1 Tax=Lycium barbarum TaxID=112863 RepID=UPI00293EE90E|nr:F-box protein CPR1-like [Lycium barbarum]